jgi:hypothetical protein
VFAAAQEVRGEGTMTLLISISKGRGTDHTLVEVGATSNRVSLDTGG